jgi:hypothetical protein
MECSIKKYIATYVVSDNPSWGDWSGEPETIILRDSEGTIIWHKNYDDAYNACYSDADNFIQNCSVAKDRGYHISETCSGLTIYDKEDFPICVYNIHELVVPFNVIFE